MSLKQTLKNIFSSIESNVQSLETQLAQQSRAANNPMRDWSIRIAE